MRLRIGVVLCLLCCATSSSAQEAQTTAIPPLIKVSGDLKSLDSTAVPAHMVGITFAIYRQPEGGAPLWIETQNVSVDSDSRYTVLLGSTTAQGIPPDLFAASEQRWLAVKVEGEPEQQRALLVSAPYAMKAAEADKLAGHSASEFVTTEALQSAVQQQLQQQANATAAVVSTASNSKNAKTGTKGPIVTNPATNFVDTTADMVVGVQQNGMGVGLSANAVSNSGLVGTTNAIGISGIVAGVEGVSSLPASFGVYGRATSTSSSQPGIGIMGQSYSPNGIGLEGMALGTGNTIGLIGQANSTSGFAIDATETATSGNTVGMLARIYSPAGIGALILNSSTAPITGALISARTSKGVQFVVDSVGNVKFGGNLATLSIGSPADHNLFLGVGAGANNVAGSGQGNFFAGNFAGFSNTSGNANTAGGNQALQSNTTGSNNTALGDGAGQNNTAGSQNIYIGVNAGANADAAAVSNLYIGSQGASAESNTVRIGDTSNQNAAYIAGVAGSTTSSGAPVFVDAAGKLGTGGGSVAFSQVAGTLSSPQFTGIYNNVVALSNTSNVFAGSFAGNGSGLTGVASGLSWPIVRQTADYAIKTGDFSTPTTYGNFVILTGATSHTFTLPNPPPPNGSCVAVGNFATAGVRSNTNVFLTVSSNGLNVDGIQTIATQPGRQAFLYCSDGSGYWRLGRQQNNPSQVGSWLYTIDSSNTSDTLKTTFVYGLDFGLNTGTTIFLLPTSANTIGTPTLDVNGLGAKKILRFGQKPLAPGDLTSTALALLIYDGNFWELINPQTIAGTVTSVTAAAPLVSSGGTTPNLSCPTCVTTPTLTGTTGSIGGSSMSAGDCAMGSAAVAGATVGHPVSVSAADGTLPNGLIILSAAVTAPSTVTVQLCAAGGVTPAANTYNVATQ